MSKKHQLKPIDHILLYKECKNNNIDYLCSAFDLNSLIFLDENVELKYYKIPSGEIFSLDILDYISKNDKPIILSTGMATYEEIQLSIDLINKNFKKQITLLHCISNYPTSYNDVNMKVMTELKKRFKYPVGFSDHTIDNYSSITATAMGASIIEKHVTIDKSLPGPDHQASSTIDEFSDLVKSIRKVEIIKGTRKKIFSDQEKQISRASRKSIVSLNDIPSGSIIKEGDICYKRPGTGFLPIQKHNIVGKRTLIDIPANIVITDEFIDND